MEEEATANRDVGIEAIRSQRSVMVERRLEELSSVVPRRKKRHRCEDEGEGVAVSGVGGDDTQTGDGVVVARSMSAFRLKDPVQCDKLATRLVECLLKMEQTGVLVCVGSGDGSEHTVECVGVKTVTLEFCMNVFEIVSEHGHVTAAHACYRDGLGVLVFKFIQSERARPVHSVADKRKKRPRVRGVGGTGNNDEKSSALLGLAYRPVRCQSGDAGESGLMLLDESSWYVYSRLSAKAKAVVAPIIELDTAQKGCTSVCTVSMFTTESEPESGGGTDCEYREGFVRVVLTWEVLCVGALTAAENSLAPEQKSPVDWNFPLLDLSRLASGVGCWTAPPTAAVAVGGGDLSDLRWSMEPRATGVVVHASFWSPHLTLESTLRLPPG